MTPITPLAIVLIGLLAACQGAGQPAATPTPALQWETFHSDEGGFTLLMPDQPKEQRQPVSTVAGSIDAIMYIAEVDNTAFGNEIPKEASADPETLLTGGREGAAKNLKGTVVSDKPIELGNYPGTEFVVETSDSLIYAARVYVVNDRLYQILFLAPKNQIDQFDVQGFFDSFTLLEK